MIAGVWERMDVSSWPIQQVEQIGSTPNIWLEHPQDGTRWLHKDTVIPANGIEQGEDWAEVVSTQVATLLGAPCARTSLCLRDGRRGSLSLSVLPKGHSLWEGHLVLERAEIDGYYPHSEGRPGVDPTRPEVRRPGHTLENIRMALEGVAAPLTFEGPDEMTGYDVFAGYMVLDALIANRDRHEQNWAILAPQLTSAPERLSPSYDHSGSLGYNLTDSRRSALLVQPGGVKAWAARGTAYRFEHMGNFAPTLVDHAARAVALCTPTGTAWWGNRLENVTLGSVDEALAERTVPGMSEVACTFASELLNVNLRRLRDAIR